MSKFRLAGQVVVPFIILGVGGAGMMAIIKSGDQGERKKREVPPAVVETVDIKLERRNVDIRAMGRIQSAQEVVMRAEVAGVVESHHPALSVGAFLLLL